MNAHLLLWPFAAGFVGGLISACLVSILLWRRFSRHFDATWNGRVSHVLGDIAVIGSRIYPRTANAEGQEAQHGIA